MHLVSMNTAIELSGLSRRTMWRRAAVCDPAGDSSQYPQNQAGPQVALEAIAGDIGIPLTEDDMVRIQQADTGDAEAQADVGLMFLEEGIPAKALHWLGLAAEQGYADAMHWLGTGYISGQFGPRNETLGLSWIMRAAAFGHGIARQQTDAMKRR